MILEKEGNEDLLLPTKLWHAFQGFFQKSKV